MKYLFTLLSIASASFVSSAQDVMPAQFRAAPLLYNPAFAGLMQTDVRITALHRSQWTSVSSRVNTWSHMSADMRILEDKLPDGDAMGIGISGTAYVHTLFDEEATGTDGSGSLTLAYHKALGGKQDHHISLGLQGSFVNKRVEDPVRPHFPMGAPPPTTSAINYMDAAIGLAYSGRLSKRSTMYGGYALYHPGQPVESFFDSPRTLYRRNTGLIGWNYKFSNAISVYTNGSYVEQGNYMQIALGTMVGATLNAKGKSPKTIYAGTWYADDGTFIPNVAVEAYSMRMRVSYSMNNGFLYTQPLTNALEVSLTYFRKLPVSNKNWDVPRM